MKTIIRKLEDRDIDEVLNLGNKERSFSSSTGNFWSREQLTNWCHSVDDVLLVAEVGIKIVGFCLFSIHLPTKKAVLENIYVHPQYRNKGIAEALLREGLATLSKKKYIYVMGLVNSTDREKFIALAESIGFVRGPEVTWIDQFLKP